MAKIQIIILLLCLLTLFACDKYRVVEKESGTFSVQTRFMNPYDLEWSDYHDKWKDYSRMNEKEACELMENLKQADEQRRKENTVRKVIKCR